MLLQDDFAKDIVLAREHGLKTYELKDRQECANQRGARAQAAQKRLEANRLVFEREAPAHLFNHR